jgi:hypothetical protein
MAPIMSESVLIDFDTEMEKERAHTEACLAAMQQDAFNKVINTVMMECMATIDKTEKQENDRNDGKLSGRHDDQQN